MDEILKSRGWVFKAYKWADSHWEHKDWPGVSITIEAFCSTITVHMDGEYREEFELCVTCADDADKSRRLTGLLDFLTP